MFDSKQHNFILCFLFLLYFNCNWCHFLNLIFCNVRFSHPDAPRMCVGGGGGGRGGAEIFIYIRRLGPFLGVQNLEF